MPKKAGNYSTDELTIEAVKIFKSIMNKGSLTQSGVARATGMAQPNISIMLRDPLARIHSWSRILEALTCLGYDIDISVLESTSQTGRISLRLES